MPRPHASTAGSAGSPARYGCRIPGALTRTRSPTSGPASSSDCPQPGAGGEDPVPAPPAGASRPLPRRPTPHVPAAGQGVAGQRRPGQGGVLRPGAHARRLCASDFTHMTDLRRDHRRPAVRPPGLPLRADLLELGDRHGLLRRVVREPRRGLAERAVGTRRRAAACTAPTGCTAAIPPGTTGAEFTQRYQALLRSLRPDGPGDPGRARQRERRRRAEPPPVQAGARSGVDAARQPGLRRAARRTQDFLRDLFGQLNASRRRTIGRGDGARCGALPARGWRRQAACAVRVDAGSTIHVEGNTYSVPSRLIGEWVEVRLYAERVEVWYAQQLVDTLPRLRGRGKHRIALPARDRLAGPQAGGVRRRTATGTTCSRRPRSAWPTTCCGRSGRRAADQGVPADSCTCAARDGEAAVEAAIRAVLDGDGTPTAASRCRLRMRELSRTPDGTGRRRRTPVDLRVYDATR